MPVTVLGVDYEYPSVYGLSQCDAFDAGLPPQCSTLDAGGSFDPLANPAFCSDSWCYVDVSNCNVASSVSVYSLLQNVGRFRSHL